MIMDYRPVTIANGASLSSEIDLKGSGLVGVIMPAAWTAAVITFQVGAPAGDLVDLYDKTGTEYSLTVAAGHACIIPPADMPMIGRLKLRSGTGAAAVNQAQDRVIYLITRAIA